MSIGITEEHAELAASLRKWARGLDGPALVRAAEGDAAAGFDEAWKAAREMGLAQIGIGEDHGGAGGSVLDVAVALEACAHELLPGPLLGVSILAQALGAGDAAAAGEAGEALEELAHGAVLSLALAPGEAWDTPGARRLVVPDAAGRWTLVPREAVSVAHHRGLDLSRRFGTVRIEDPAALDGLPRLDLDGVRIRRMAVTLAAAEAAGVARWCLETAVEYAGVREQFGRKIGSFQAIKHLCAQMLETAETVTGAAWDVATAADAARDGAQETEEQWAFAADVAAVVAFDGAVQNAKDCIQVLGGIGFTWEHDAHLYLRRALSLRALVEDRGEAATGLARRAAEGTRRRVEVDLGEPGRRARGEVRRTVERIAALPEEQQRAALVECGYLMPHWPRPHGLDADPVLQLVIDEELSRAGVARPDIVIAGWALPTILEHGTEQQRERFVRPSLLGELTWCQLFSEPGSGSDLASLRTRAVKVEGGWRLTGQKVWTSMAREADWAICLARTDPEAPQHRGITYFLVDMRSSGLEIRPLREITGEALFNEVFLDEVFVPDDLVVGEVGGGWRLARTTLANERVAMANSRLDRSCERAVALLDQHTSATLRAAVGEAVALATVCTLLGVRTVLRTLSGRGPGAESSVAKLIGVRNRQDAAELVLRLHGPAGVLGGEDVAGDVWEMLNTRCLSIAGGTTQILRNVAAERILGLPR